MAKKKTLKSVTPEAKRLYKTGRYKTYAAAVKAAFGAVKIIQKGETKRTPAKKVLMQKRSNKGTFKGYSAVSGIDKQIGAIKKGSTYVYHKGMQIERMPIEVSGKRGRKEKKYIYIALGKVHHTLPSAKKAINTATRK